jgi:hypothetical protein
MKNTMLRIATAVAAVTAALTLSTGLAAADTQPSPAADQQVTDQAVIPVLLKAFGQGGKTFLCIPTGSWACEV